jgi:hypothetical protein
MAFHMGLPGWNNWLEGKEYETYAKVLQKEGLLYPDGAFPGKVIGESLYFEYGGKVSLGTFSKEYDSKNWLSRKITALPLVALSIMKVAFHFFNALTEPFFLVSSDPEKKAKIRKAELFTCVQDFKEAFGRVVTLFSDVRGSLLVEQALFQKRYYNFACKKDLEPFFESTLFMSEHAKELSFFALRELGEEERREAVQRYELEQFIQAFSDCEGGFWKVLENADEEMLKLFTIWDVKRDRQPVFLQKEYFEIPIFLRKKEALERISMKEVYLLQEDESSGSHMDVLWRLRKRLLMPEEFQLVSVDELGDVFKISFAFFLQISSGVINEHIRELPSWVFCYFSEGQAREIDVSKLSNDQMVKFLSVNQAEFKERVHRIPEEWIYAHKKQLGSRYTQLLLDQQGSLWDATSNEYENL